MYSLSKTFACLFISLFIASSHVNAQDSKTFAIEKSSLGSTNNVHKAGKLFFAGQFSSDDIKAISDSEITRVVTLRTEGEIEFDEESAVVAAGMEFVRLPYKTPESLTDNVFDKARELLKDQSKKTLFHCGSANRVAGVWLPYRVLDEGVPLKQALAEAAEIGLKKPFVKDKALAYIQRNLLSNEQSVRPGINKGYKSSDFDVAKMVERFELESREIYLLQEKIVASCEIKPGDIVADVGAGTGLFSRLFSDAVGETGWVYAVDIAPRMVGHIVQEATKQGQQNVTGVVCPENSVSLPPNSVDLVFICDTYHHFEYPKSSLASIKRALRPGGRLVVIDFERIEGRSREWLLNHVRAGKETFRAEIQDAGFDFQEEKTIAGFRENYFLLFQKEK